MIKSVTLGEEIVVSTKNNIGLLADISKMVADYGINISAVLGHEVNGQAQLLLVTSANIRIIDELRKKGYESVEETEVVVIDLENKPGALKVVTTELAKGKIDLRYLYVTSCSCGGSSRMVIQTTNNEKAMALLDRFTQL
ncbi:MAG: hypothetical protein ABIJ27_00910 [Candidatus Omnitrophota bacterium]